MFSVKNYKILPLDFSKPWWYLLWQQKWLFIVVLLTVILTQILWSLVPFIAAQLFEAQSYYLCIVVFFGWIVLDWVLSVVRITVNTKFQLQSIHSIYQNAHVYLLTVDPRYHVHRASGTIHAKIERGARGYEDFADYISFEIVPLVTGLITVITALAYYSLWLALTMTVFILAILALGYYYAMFVCEGKRERDCIKTDDFFKTVAAENLAQIQLIRSSFASNFRIDLLNRAIMQNMKTDAVLWFAYAYLFAVLGILYIVSLFILAVLLVWQIKVQVMSAATALGLFLVYLQSSKEIVRFGRLLRKIIKTKTVIKDLFEFIPAFGQQHFPVLGEQTIDIAKENSIVIDASNIYFDYGKARLFDAHTFKLSCLQKEASKLYGIIGASGAGKTTLLSILGGQLKPIKGTILINDSDIYAVNDAVRSQIIALQGQIATSMRGTVKSNMLLGLPENHPYTDVELEKILERVGLLAILRQNDGLLTMLGEGGLNLSGGQRQRLNFAGLYLRAHYYKPLVVLIDEPTSSLDEISEAAITDMIEELAQSSLTLVVAHRLNTIKKAVGIIDLSLLQQEKEIKAYTTNELLKYSEYYQELVQGKIQLDS